MDEMKIVRNILLIALALLAQSTLISRVAIMGVRPDLAMLVLIFLVYTSSPVESVLYGFFIGFIQDVYTPEFLGANAFTMALMGFFLDMIKERLSIDNFMGKALVTFGMCTVHDVIFLSFYTRFDFSMMINLFVRLSLLGSLYTMVVLMVFVALVEWVLGGGSYFVVHRLFGNRR